MTDGTAEFLKSGEFVDAAHPDVRAFAERTVEGTDGEPQQAVALYRAVRDGIRYDPYIDFNDPDNFRASGALAAGRAFCIGKSTLLAACCRAVGIPARVGFADVRNHVTSPRLYALVQTDVFVWHSYTDILIDGKWVKATPAFDVGVCERAGLQPLEFDGRNDSLFQACDLDGRRRMEYLHHRGTYADVPHDEIVADFRARYPAMMAPDRVVAGNFQAEAVAPK
jgi:transglutaminase-like putative cysteine protease